LKETIEKCKIETEDEISEHWFDRPEISRQPYRGEDPFCINRVSLGTREGLRNKYLLRYESYLLNCVQLNVDLARRRIGGFNNRCDPPFEKDELNRRFAYIAQKQYNFGCHDPILKSLCDPNRRCPLRKKEVEEETKSKFDAETESKIKEEVERILQSDNQLEALTPHLDNVVVGEANNKKVLFTVALSAEYEDPKKKQIMSLLGESGGGKTQLANLASLGHRVKKVGRFSAHALDYSDTEDFNLLYMKELPIVDEEKFGVSRIKFLASDDEGYNIEYTIRDEETGRFTTEVRHVPPISVISTTTRLLFDPQYDRRTWKFPIDDSTEQTSRVMEWKAERGRQEDEKKLGLRKITDYDFSKAVIQRFVESIKSVPIIIPFRKTITEMFSSKVLRLRSDIDKMTSFLEFYGLLNLKRLPKVNSNVYVLTPKVAVEGLDMLKGIILRMVTGLEKRLQQLLETLNEVNVESGAYTQPKITGEESREIVVHPNLKGSKIDKSVRENIAVRLGISDDTVRVRLNALVSSGYMSSDKGKGRPGKTFTLLYDVIEILQKLMQKSGILSSPHSLEDKMKKEASKWLKSKCRTDFGEGIWSKEFTIIKELVAVDSSKHIPSKKSVLHSQLGTNETDSAKMAEKNAEKKEKSISCIERPNNPCMHVIKKGISLQISSQKKTTNPDLGSNQTDSEEKT